jgi:thymidine kinase
MASLHIIMGPMFAGKSTSLINKIQDLLKNGILQTDILIFNHQIDNRYSEESSVCTHDGKKIQSKPINKINDILNLEECNTPKYIFIDEAQFFDDLYLIKTLLFNNQHTIYISGLDGDYKQQPFIYNTTNTNTNTNTNCYTSILTLIPLATSICKLNAKCNDCGEPAPFTKRTIVSNELILVGGSDDYKPVCIKHL